MHNAISFGSRSTADQVLAGIDLTGKRMVVTGCNSGLGFQLMNSLAANGARVYGLARSFARAADACKAAGPSAYPVACDLADFESIAVAATTLLATEPESEFDAIIACAGIARLPTLSVKYGIEEQFLVNHIGHFALINALAARLRSGCGRVVMVGSSSASRDAPAEGIMFDNLDGRRFYEPRTFYGQSKMANALYARELARRLSSRGIAVNSVHPGAMRGTGIARHASRAQRLSLSLRSPFLRSAARGAATPALLAASPLVAGMSGQLWADCRVAPFDARIEERGLAERLWQTSAAIVDKQIQETRHSLRQAA